MKNIKNIVLALVVCFSMAAKAQVSAFGFNYVISVPTGNTSDFIGEASYRGASFEYTYVPDDHIALHFEGGWNNFYEKIDRTTYEYKTASITGTQYRYLESVPLFLGVHYIILPEAIVKPYVGLDIGLMYTDVRADIGMYSILIDSWQFGFKPEAGAAIELGDNAYLKLSAKYYQTFKTNDLAAQSFVGFNMGLAVKVE